MTFDRFLGPGEKVVFSIRRHPFAFLSSILILSVMGLLPPALIVLGTTIFSWNLSPSTEDWIAVGAGTFYLFFLILALVFWMDYYYDLYIVTDRHVLDIDQTSLLSQRISHISLVRVQDVTTRVKGFWQNLLDFGPITVQTAGHEEDILLEDVPHPQDVAARIMKLHDELIAKQQRQGEAGSGEGVHPPNQ